MANQRITELTEKTLAEVIDDGVVPVAVGATTYKTSVANLKGNKGDPGVGGTRIIKNNEVMTTAPEAQHEWMFDPSGDYPKAGDFILSTEGTTKGWLFLVDDLDVSPSAVMVYTGGGVLNMVGADGKSAYQLAVQAGYTGTLAEWLDSLVGTDGLNGLSIYPTGTKLNLGIGGETEAVAVSTPAGREVQGGDLVISTATATTGVLARVDRIENLILNTNEQAVSVPEKNNWRGIAYGNGVFIAVAYSGTNRVMRSTNNGQSWEVVSVPQSNWYDIAYGNGVFIAVAYSGTPQMIRSTDGGVTWESVNIYQSAWRGIAYGNGVFVIISYLSPPQWSSDGGETWNVATLTEQNYFSKTTFGNGVFVSVGTTGTNRIMRSIDNGQSWTAVSAPEQNSWSGVGYGDGVFIAVSYDGANRIARSTDYGQTWQAIVAPVQNNWQSVTYGNGVFMACASSGTINRFMSSIDNGLTWQPIVSIQENNWNNIIHAEDIFVAVASNSLADIMLITATLNGGTIVETLARLGDGLGGGNGGDINGAIAEHNAANDAHEDIRALIAVKATAGMDVLQSYDGHLDVAVTRSSFVMSNGSAQSFKLDISGLTEDATIVLVDRGTAYWSFGSVGVEIYNGPTYLMGLSLQDTMTLVVNHTTKTVTQVFFTQRGLQYTEIPGWSRQIVYNNAATLNIEAVNMAFQFDKDIQDAPSAWKMYQSLMFNQPGVVMIDNLLPDAQTIELYDYDQQSVILSVTVPAETLAFYVAYIRDNHVDSLELSASIPTGGGGNQISTDANNQLTHGSDGGLFVPPTQGGGGGGGGKYQHNISFVKLPVVFISISFITSSPTSYQGQLYQLMQDIRSVFGDNSMVATGVGDSGVAIALALNANHDAYYRYVTSNGTMGGMALLPTNVTIVDTVIPL
jgi:hypothetical protein